ncbi:MAG: hypothetical protein O7J95_08845, partial [Planctomycetota bacterium]|nr:hypothetical protein [Planctomycetota bacterium]
MRATKRFPPVGGLALVVGFVLFSGTTYSQVTLLEDDFESAAIDEAKWRRDAAPFETGGGDFQATQADGQLTIAGTATQNWWPGLALATVPTFTASPEAPLTFEFDRISHDRTDNTSTGAGENSSTRTSMWISDASRENYVLYSHNSNEGGWTYNKRVGDPDDNATAGGANIGEFNGEDANFGVHRLKMVADGTTVQLFLDDLEGPVVNFPFTEGIVCRLGSYARRGAGPQPTDSVTGVFDNVLITGASGECVALSPDFTQVLAGEMAELTLQIPAGVARPAAVTVTSSDPAVAIPTGAVAGALNVVFADGDPPFRSLPLDVVGEGIAEFSLTHDLGGCTGDPVRIFVPAVLFEDDFEDGALGRGEWFTNDEPFEDGGGVFDLVEENGTVRLFGTGDQQFWPGIAVMTNATFNATPDLPVTFQIDQTLTSTSQGAFRAGVWAANCERDEFVFFSFIRGTSGDWVVNS